MKSLPTLKQCLVDTELVRLRVIARLWGVDVEASRGFEIAAELAQYMPTPAHAADSWRLLPEGERRVMEALLNAGGTMPAAAFIRRFGEIRAIGPGRLEREAPWRDPVSPAEGLWYRGFVFAAFAGIGRESYPIYFTPSELRVALPFKAEAKVGPVQLEPVTPPAFSCTGAQWLLGDVTSALSFVHNEAVQPRDASPTVWPEETRQSFSRHLHDRDPARLDFILHLMSQLGWLKLGGDGQLRLVAEPVMAWLRESDSEGLATLIGAWRHMRGWDELWHLTGLLPDDTATWRSDPTLARTALARHIDGLTPGEWVRVSDFMNAIRETGPDFLRPGGDYETWYVRDAASGASLTGFDSWDQVEGTLLRALLMGPAMWLGLVELGANAEGEALKVFRVQAGLVFAVHSEPAPLAVRSDLAVTIPVGRRFDRFQLARVADLVCVEDPCVYRLTPNSLGRARQQQIGLERVLSFLDGLTDEALPEAMQSSLTRWAERGTEVWLERTVILRVSDEAVMKQITDSPRTKRFVRRLVSPTTAMVLEPDWPELLAGIAELGLLPELNGIEEDQLRAQE